MSHPLSPYAGMMNAGLQQYHGIRSINEHGEIEHARKLAEIAMREEIVSTQREAVAWANHEIERLYANLEKTDVHQVARAELKAESQLHGDLVF